MYRDQAKCVDINECMETQNGGCNMDCINTQGSFFCACSDSYILDMDERTCIGNLLCLPLICIVRFKGCELMRSISKLLVKEQNFHDSFFTGNKLCFITITRVNILKYSVILLITKILAMWNFYLANILYKLIEHSGMAFLTLQREKLLASVWLCLNMEKYVVQVTRLKSSIH